MTALNDSDNALISSRNSPEAIYTQVTEGVQKVIAAMDERTDEAEDAEVSSQIVASLVAIQNHVVERQRELQATAEWKDFTVGLYGETNAGKSTIIETLRILLGETAKLEQRRKFQALTSEFGLRDADLDELQAAIAAAGRRGAAAYAKRDEREAAFAVTLASLEAEQATAEHAAVQARNARPWWKKLWAKIKLPAEDAAVQLMAANIMAEGERHQAEIVALTGEFCAANAEAGKATENLHNRKRLMAQLLEVADGSIVGDGRPDFTQATQSYKFDLGDTRIILLDVPGIEGGEGGVRREINTAVQTAHAVFYVTGKAARPQHGDNHEGTLEKIKRHLTAQTEVWAVFNKRITAPMPLRRPGPLFANDVDGLLDLESSLRDELGDQFKGVLTVSAYPAFLAVADCLPPVAALGDTKDALAGRGQARAKFLADFDTPSLLEKTGFSTIANHLREMARDAPRKIIRANIHKATQVLKDVVAELEGHAKIMEKHASLVTSQSSKAQIQIDIAVDQFAASLRSGSADGVRGFQTCVRKTLYARIDGDIGTDEVKRAMELTVEDQAHEMQKRIEAAFKLSAEELHDETTKVADRFQKHLSDLEHVALPKSGHLTGSLINLDLRIDTGVKWGALVATLVTTTIGVFTGPPGWYLIAVSLVGAVWSVGKAVWSWFDSDFKKAQQRKAVDENLAIAVTMIKKQLSESEEKVLQTVKDAVPVIKSRLNGPTRILRNRAIMLRTSAQRLHALHTQIDLSAI